MTERQALRTFGIFTLMSAMITWAHWALVIFRLFTQPS